MKAPETVVRSAPSEAAPEIARLRAGDRLPADDRPLGAWRRVQLPNGRFGVVHDADVEVTAAPPPPPAVTAAPPANHVASARYGATAATARSLPAAAQLRFAARLPPGGYPG